MINEGEKTVMKWLLEHSFDNYVAVHTKDVERKIVSDGLYCLSVSKFIRNLRSMGYIDYPDPRKKEHAHIYKISILRDIAGNLIKKAEIQKYIQEVLFL